ncbi:MAG TPA: tripartite tricarboxylate transporter substrate binding protein, partial [Reyranella sp.]|nr:tripartite tricarboxylate transporter substrate binding protein [Reyranella sp.]
MLTFRRSLSRRTLLAASALAAVPASSFRAGADTIWPTKAVHITVPFAPGGSGDITARLVGKYIEEKTGQPFVVENKPGANGIVGVLSVKSAAPDGYSLMLATTSTQAANVHMYKSPGYDPERDFQVVGVIGTSGTFLVVPTDSPFKSLADLVAHAKANPGKLNYGYFNASSQVPSAVLGERAGVDWLGVGYKAIGNAWNDLYAGAIQFMF